MMRPSRYWAEARTALRTFPGFQLFISVTYFLSLLVLVWPLIYLHGITSFTLRFVYGYWSANPWRIVEVSVLLVLFPSVFLTDVLRGFHQKQFGRYRQEAVPFGWVATTKVLGSASFVCALYVVPLVSLYVPDVVLNAGKLAWTLSAVMPYLSLFKGEDTGSSIKALSRLNFDRMYFDVAALAPLRSPLYEDIATCLERCEKGPSDPKTQQFLRDGERGSPWGGLEDLFVRLGNFIGVAPDCITFHERTTNAIVFALEEIIKHRDRQGLPSAKVLTTDIEYPGIAEETLAELQHREELTLLPLIPLKHLILSGSSKERIQETLISQLKCTGADIVLLSHVYYASGFVTELEGVLQALPIVKKPILLIDGAQSMGNVEIASKLLQQVEYYAAGAHKWLLIPRHLGILVRNHELLRRVHGFSTLDGPNRPDSCYPIVNKPYSVTISYEPYFGLSSMLRDELQPLRTSIAAHNRRLADVFRYELLAIGHRAFGDESMSGIVSVSFGKATKDLHKSLQASGIKCKFLALDDETISYVAIRFCFHYYHGKDDVYKLIDRVEAELLRMAA